MERKEAAAQRLTARIEGLVADFSLPEAARDQLLSLVVSLSGEHAPTAVKDPESAVEVHLADSLSGLGPVAEFSPDRIADIGSGCGIPGLVLAAALPDSEVVAVDSQRRRCQFIEEAAADAGIGNARVQWSRAEEWDGGLGSCDVVTARALADLPVLLEYAAPLLRVGGMLVAWKGRLEGGELERGTRAASILGMSEPRAEVAEPWPGGGRRHIVVSELSGEVPPGYPRRPGMALKRPLGH